MALDKRSALLDCNLYNASSWYDAPWNDDPNPLSRQYTKSRLDILWYKLAKWFDSVATLLRSPWFSSLRQIWLASLTQKPQITCGERAKRVEPLPGQDSNLGHARYTRPTTFVMEWTISWSIGLHGSEALPCP